MNYQRNKANAITRNIGATMTRQEDAASTDINVIVRQLLVHGTVPGSAKPPIYADFSQIPDNLRDMIELGRKVNDHKSALPPALQSMTVEELVTANPEALHKRIQEEGVYIERHNKLPPHLKGLARADILKMTEKEFSDTIQPRTQEIPPAPQGDKK